MTEIHCEHCGPTRIAPHDVNCPDTDVVRKGDVIGWAGPPMTDPDPEQHLHFQPLPDSYAVPVRRSAVTNRYITRETHPHMFSPIVEKATTHYTVKGRRGAECNCGYNPYIDHPEAGRGQLFAYVGQHIKNESGI